MARTLPVQLRLITDLDTTIYHQCSRCLYLHDSGARECPNIFLKSTRTSGSPVPNPRIRTKRTSDSSALSEFNNSIRTKASVGQQRPLLRRKESPTALSLRETREKQSTQSLIRAKHSDEKLREVYEAQLLAYLESPLANF